MARGWQIRGSFGKAAVREILKQRTQRTEHRGHGDASGKSGSRLPALQSKSSANADALRRGGLVDHRGGREYDFFSADTHDHFARLGIKRRRKN